MNYQGRLTRSGIPVSGNEVILFRIYDAPAAGAIIWSSDAQSVHATNGLFQSVIGQTTSMGSPVVFSNIDWGAGDRYLEVQIGLDVLQPRELLTGVAYAFLAKRAEQVEWNGILNKPASFVPSGAIVMWSGTIASIPSGWVLCDGNNGTPDLRDKFVMGAPAGENPGPGGGSHTRTLSEANLPPHTHTISSSGTHGHMLRFLLTTGTLGVPAPYQGILASSVTFSMYRGGSTWAEAVGVNGDGDHNHGGATGSIGSGTAFDIRPAYYKIAFIMKQ